MSSSEPPALGSSIALELSSSIALVLSSSRVLVPAIPLLSPSGGDVFAAVVPPTRASFCFTKKKIAG